MSPGFQRPLVWIEALVRSWFETATVCRRLSVRQLFPYGKRSASSGVPDPAYNRLIPNTLEEPFVGAYQDARHLRWRGIKWNELELNPQVDLIPSLDVFAERIDYLLALVSFGELQVFPLRRF